MAINHVIGVAAALRGIDKITDKHIKGAQRGVIKAGLVIEGVATKNAPIQFGNLRASAYTISIAGKESGEPEWKTGYGKSQLAKIKKSYSRSVRNSKIEALKDRTGMTVFVGFGANYAMIVHELHAKRGKFLERALRTEGNRTTKIVADEIRKG